jgi:hypothetical protein
MSAGVSPAGGDLGSLEGAPFSPPLPPPPPPLLPRPSPPGFGVGSEADLVLRGDNSIEYLQMRLWWWFFTPPQYDFLPNATRPIQLVSCEALVSTFHTGVGSEPVTIACACMVVLLGLLLLAPPIAHNVCSEAAAKFTCSKDAPANRRLLDYIGGALILCAGMASVLFHASSLPALWNVSNWLQGVYCCWFIEAWLRRLVHRGKPIVRQYRRLFLMLLLPFGQFFCMRVIYPHAALPSSDGSAAGFQRWIFPLLVLWVIALLHAILARRRRFQPSAALVCLIGAALCVSFDAPTCRDLTSALGYPVGLLGFAHVLSGTGYALLALSVQSGRWRRRQGGVGEEDGEAAGNDVGDVEAASCASGSEGVGASMAAHGASDSVPARTGGDRRISDMTQRLATMAPKHPPDDSTTTSTSSSTHGKHDDLESANARRPPPSSSRAVSFGNASSADAIAAMSAAAKLPQPRPAAEKVGDNEVEAELDGNMKFDDDELDFDDFVVHDDDDDETNNEQAEAAAAAAAAAAEAKAAEDRAKMEAEIAKLRAEKEAAEAKAEAEAIARKEAEVAAEARVAKANAEEIHVVVEAPPVPSSTGPSKPVLATTPKRTGSGKRRQSLSV